MKLAAMILAMSAAAGAHMRDFAVAPGHTLTAYVVDHRDSRRIQIAASQELASKMFAQIGLRVQWHMGAPDVAPTRSDMAVVVELVDETPVERKPGALAFARAFEGIHLTIFYDRIIAQSPLWPHTLMAHVLVHEITHLLEGVDRHSTTGVMKARFTPKDTMQMRSAPLPFAAEDRFFIECGIADRLGLTPPAVTSAETAAPAAPEQRW